MRLAAEIRPEVCAFGGLKWGLELVHLVAEMGDFFFYDIGLKFRFLGAETGGERTRLVFVVYWISFHFCRCGRPTPKCNVYSDDKLSYYNVLIYRKLYRQKTWPAGNAADYRQSCIY